MRFQIRNFEPLLITLLRISDTILASAIFYFSVFFFQGTAPFLFEACLIVFLISMLVFEYGGLYTSWRFSSINEEVKQVTQNSAFASGLIIFIGFFLRIVNLYSRRAILLWIILCPLIMIFERFIIRWFLKFIRQRGRNLRKAVIVGTGQMGRKLAHWINVNPWSGTKIIGFFNGTKEAVEGYPVIGKYSELPEYVRNNHIDIVYIALPAIHSRKLSVILHELVNSTVSIYYVPETFVNDYLLKHSHINYIDDIPVISIADSPVQGFNAVLKRAEDIVVSALILALISPFMAGIAVTIKLTSKGPVIFKQWRYGLDGRKFHVYKFRTMMVCEDGYSMKPATEGDQRITRVGCFLRKFSLDELPQFLNVLGGNMSVVGPRPHAISMVEEYRILVNGSMLRHKIKPGITGLAQLYATRGEVDTRGKLQERIEYDLLYMRRWSLWLDLRIIGKTALVMWNYRREMI